MNTKIKNNSTILVDETIAKIQEVVRINSERDVANAAPGAPFGPGIAQSLDLFLEMAAEIGMKTYRDPEGYYGYAEVGPEGTDMLGILGHLDVVPANDPNQWDEAGPYSADIVDGKIIGRGTLDDKGPLVVNLMAVKSLIQLGYEFPMRVRFILGCAEETTWECINKYNELEEMPTEAYTPDANFPCINAEKTIHHFDLQSDVAADFELKSLGAYNAVADTCSYVGPKMDELCAELTKLDFKFREEEGKIVTVGKSAHGMQPQMGINAITRMCIALNNIGVHSIATDFLANNIKEDYYAETLMGELMTEEVSGNLTLSVGHVDIDANGQKVGFDSRIPVLLDHEAIINTYKTRIEEVATYAVVKTQDKLYVPIDDPFCSTLLNIYREVANEPEAMPLSSGGGTYARAMKKGMAFGMVFASKNMIDNMHQPNECLEIKFIEPALEIYTRAIYELTSK